MASRFPPEYPFQPRARKGYDLTWSCDIHREPIKFYCKKHDVSICHPCATKDHCKKPCELDDIEDVVLEWMSRLDDKRRELQQLKKKLKTLDSKLEFSATSARNHLQTLNDEVKSTQKEKSRSVKDDEEKKIRLINEEADEEIRIINKKRDTQIKSCNAENQLLIINESQAKLISETKVMSEVVAKKIKDLVSKNQHAINKEADEGIRIISEKRGRQVKACTAEIENQLLIINESQAKLISETKAISEVVAKKLKYLKSKNQHAIGTVDNIHANIKKIMQNDKTLVNEAPRALASLDDKLGLNVHQDVSDCLDRIQREVQRVKFVEVEVGGEHYGRIDGHIGKWELVKSIHIPSVYNVQAVRGLVSDDEICAVDVVNNATYVTNISTEHTEKVIEIDRSTYIMSSASIDSNVIVCGKWIEGCTGDSLDGCITLYDRQWKVIRDISIPMDPSLAKTCVYVDVDRDGMILAAQRDQFNIYVINPADGKKVNTIMMQGKVVMGEIQSLSSGDIVVKTGPDEFSVISRSEKKKAVIHSDEWEASSCHVDKLTDTLYITYNKRTISTVDQVSCDGIIQSKRIVEYEESGLPCINPCLIAPSGNLIACNGDNFWVYKKRFIV